MKIRIAAATAVIGALVLSISGAQAGGPPVMDGKKVKVLTLNASGGTQDHDQDQANLNGIDYSVCKMPECATLKFVYKPAKGAKGGLMITATWGKPAVTDYDLFMYQLDAHGNGTDVGQCASAGSASEKVYMPPAGLHSGKTYVMVVHFFRSVADSVHATIAMGAPNTIPTTVPSQVDADAHLNCTL